MKTTPTEQSLALARKIIPFQPCEEEAHETALLIDQHVAALVAEVGALRTHLEEEKTLVKGWQVQADSDRAYEKAWRKEVADYRVRCAAAEKERDDALAKLKEAEERAERYRLDSLRETARYMQADASARALCECVVLSQQSIRISVNNCGDLDRIQETVAAELARQEGQA